MNEITIIILISITIVETAVILGILINKNNNSEEYDIYIEENTPLQQAKQKIIERLIKDQNTIKSLTIINTVLTMALIIITIIEKIFTKTF